jgi:hypothetical protein
MKENLFTQVATILKVPVKAIKNMDEDKAVNIIVNTFTDFKNIASAISNNCSQFHPVEKLLCTGFDSDLRSTGTSATDSCSNSGSGIFRTGYTLTTGGTILFPSGCCIPGTHSPVMPVYSPMHIIPPERKSL